MRTVVIRTAEDLTALRARVNDTRELRNVLGAFLVSESQKAFDEQRLGEYQWPQRYPGQRDPFVNSAAVLERANVGAEPTDDDFQPRPALIGHTGDLKRRVAFSVSGDDLLTVGNNLPYASLHQFGGETSFPVNETARTTLIGWCATAGRNHPARSKIRLLAYLHNWSQTIIQRPFIGVTPQAALDMRDITERYIGGPESEAA